MTTNEQLQDLAIRHAVFLHRYAKGLEADILKFLKRGEEQTVEKLAARLALIQERGFDIGPKTTERLNRMIEELKVLNDQVYAQVETDLTEQLTALGSSEAAFQAKALSASIAIDYTARLPSPQLLKSIVTERPIYGRILKPFVAGLSAANMDRIEQNIRDGMATGESIDKIVARIVGTKANGYRDGVAEVSRRSARSMVRTATTHVSNQAAQETWAANESVLKGYRWISTLDTRTTLICAERDGKVYELGKGPVPPAHPSCRSITVGVTKSWQELGVDRAEVSEGTRASMDGQVPKSENFETWLKKQSADRQDEVLGVKRGELFRSGRYKLRDFIDDRGNTITLQELGETAPVAVIATEAATVATGPFSPINPAITNESITVKPRKVVAKSLDGRLAVNAADPRYDPMPEFRGSKASDFGKAQLSSLTDEAASMMEALMSEADAIADQFGIPRLRAIKSGTGSWAARMGDGNLHINHTIFNGYAGQIGSRVSPVANLAAEKDALALKLKALREEIDAMKANIATLSGAEKDAAIMAYMDKADAFNAIRKEWIAIDKKLLKARSTDKAAEIKEASTWKPGDDPQARPYTTDGYFSDPLDRARSTVYHEMAHHVHQMVRKNGLRRTVATPPVERELRALFANKFHKLGEGFAAKQRVASKYGTTDPYEWFAENFALYMMRRFDLVEPEVKELIERLLKEAKQ